MVDASLPDHGSRMVKVAKFEIIKPVGTTTWKQLGTILRSVQYRVFRLANLAVSEAYLGFHLWREGKSQEYKTTPIGQLNNRLGKLLLEEESKKKKSDAAPETPIVFAQKGAVNDYITGALQQYKIGSILNKNKWSDVIRGKASLPTFRNDMAIPIRCDKPTHRRLEKMEDGNVEVDLIVTLKPYPRVLLGTHKLGDGQQAVLERLLANPEQKQDGYRQRCMEIKQDSQTKKWYLYITYDFPAKSVERNKDVVVGVDVGVSVPLYAAVNNGLARLGRRHFAALGHAIRHLQKQVDARRRSIQQTGRSDLSKETARSGHGRKRKLLPIHTLEGRIDKAYSTLNHQLSAAVIQFALDQGAGVIQMEDLATLKDQLRGAYIGSRWRYHQLQQFIEYKAHEASIKFQKVNPQYTSRRCSRCGWIHRDFDRSMRDKNRTEGKVARFVCPNPDCPSNTESKQQGRSELGIDPDFNAARNLATPNIEQLIREQCKAQNIPYHTDADDPNSNLKNEMTS